MDKSKFNFKDFIKALPQNSKKIGLKTLKWIVNLSKITYSKTKWSLFAIGVGILVGFIVMLIFSPSTAVSGLISLLTGGFTTGASGFGDVILYATPIILTGTALVITFKSGLFNIGASGQMIIGAYVAVHIGVLWNLPGALHWIVALVLGAVAGGLWGIIPGLLKAFRNVNEVVSSIMLNYIGMFIVIILINSNIRAGILPRSENVQASAELPQLSFLFGNSDANIGIFIAIAVVILVHILFKKTTIGYELKATGFNPDASKYAGMSARRNIIVSFGLSGLIVGLAGAIQFLVIGTNISTLQHLLPQGYDGISVALLGMTEPIGALLSGLFLSHLRQGGFYMQLHDFPTQIVEMIIAIIVFSTSITAGIRLFIKYLAQKRNDRKSLESEVIE